MKYICAILVAFVLFVPSASAVEGEKNIEFEMIEATPQRPALRVRIVSPHTVQFACRKAINRHDALKGCYWFDTYAGELRSETIYISNALSNDELPFVFFHEFGHYLMWNLDMTLWAGDKELAADEFSAWMLGELYSPEKTKFFTDAVVHGF